VSENVEDYSAYLAWQSNYSTTWALFSGFTFTAITMILFQYPDPSQIQAQISLFVLTVLLDIFLYHLYTRRALMENCVRIAPPLPKSGAISPKEKPGFSTLLANELIWILLGVSVVAMFLVWNLIYLTLASTVAGLLVIIFTYINWTKPFREFLKKRPLIRR